MTRPFDYRDTAETIVLTRLEWMSLLYVALAEPAPSLTGLAEIIGNSEALRLEIADHPQYEAERTAFLSALATLARLPGGVSFGRLHFGDPDGCRRPIYAACAHYSALSDQSSRSRRRR